MNALDTAIYSRLQGGTALTSLLYGGTAGTAIWHLQAKENATLPYVVFSIQGGGDENLTAHRTKNLIVFVRGFATGSNGAAVAGSIDAQIDTLLHLNPLTVSGWTNLWLARETDLETVENEPSGNKVFMSGAFYRVRLED